MKEINKTRVMFISIIAVVLITSAYVEFETARHKSSYPYMYGIKVIHGDTVIEGFDISGHEIGIIVDAPNVIIRDTRINNCIDGIVTTANADYCTISSNLINECINGITTSDESDNVVVANNFVKYYDMAFIIGSSNSSVINNVAYSLGNITEEG